MASIAAPTTRPNLVLAICCMSVLLVAMDVTIVNVALPTIRENLHAEVADLQWVVDAYILVVGSLMLFAGSMSDRFGRRRTFQLGLILFTLGSLLCSLAPTIQALIAFRALQGIGASMLNPVALSIVTNTFADPQSRARAIGAWGAVFGAALGIGPLLGGVLTQTVGWRFIFLVNVPIGIVAVVLAALYVPESKAEHPRAFDVAGQALIAVALAALTYALIEGQRLGWSSAPIVGLFALSGAAAAGLLVFEPRQREPVVDLRFFRSVPFSAANLAALLAFGSFSALLFLNALYLQQERGFSPFQTGLCTLPIALMAFFCGPASGQLVARFGTRPSLIIAGTGMLLSAIALTHLSNTTPAGLLLVIYLVFGIGFGTVNPAISTVAVSGMPRSQAGVAAAVASTSRQIGITLGVAIAGTIVGASVAGGHEFANATHPIWWTIAGCGAAIIVLGWLTNTSWAQSTSRTVAAASAAGA